MAHGAHSSGEWNDNDYDVGADDVVGPIMRAAAAPERTP
jgi:hypothetical protein